MMFDTSVLESDPIRRGQILGVLQAALDAVEPFDATRRFLVRQDNTLQVGDRSYDLDRYQRVFVVGAGKAGAPMARAVEEALGDRIQEGVVVVKTGHTGPTDTVAIEEADHPRPNQAGVEAGKRILQLAESANENDLVIALLSGGGSALLVAPAPGLELADIQAMTDALLASGATINEVNCLRKHVSAVKGGQLARAVAPATLITLALSDVIGSPLDVIASGPTVPDQTTWEDAWAIVERYGLESELPELILARLRAGLNGETPDTPKPDDPVFETSQTIVVADNRMAAEEAVRKAESAGYNTLLLTTYLEGEASQVARVAVGLGREIEVFDSPVPAPACLVLGGETTVTLGPSPGKGGRNQELALSAGLALQGNGRIVIASLATDGTDGPTDSAGGIADGTTVERGKQKGLDAESHLRSHNAYPFLEAVGDLFVTGPTQTNVNDLVFVFVH
jgi:glycerate 2-kinase